MQSSKRQNQKEGDTESMTYSRFKERADEIYKLGEQMREPGCNQFAESRYKVIVAELLLLILVSVQALRAVLWIVLVALIANFLF